MSSPLLRTSVFVHRSVHFVLWILTLIILLATLATHVVEAEEQKDWQFTDLQACNLTTLEMSQLSDTDRIDPCIMYQIEPDVGIINNTTSSSSSSSNSNVLVVTTLLLTPTNCLEHRDGAKTGIEFLNADHDGQGIPIGFYQDQFVQFRHVSVLTAHLPSMKGDAYQELHSSLLENMLMYYQNEYTYIIGTCSGSAAAEREPAKKYQTILLAQVGAPGFYQEYDNPWLFGIHINSDEYPIDSVRRLQFLVSDPTGKNNEQPQQQQQQDYLSNSATVTSSSQQQQQQPLPQQQNQQNANKQQLRVGVIYREHSAFFYSTCRSAIESLQDAGFVDILDLPYDPDADNDGDGVPNRLDVDFLQDLADRVCPPPPSPSPPLAGNVPDNLHPAIFLCTINEQDVILQRFKENGCRLTSVWLTAATWTWAFDHANEVAYIQGGGQWHPSFKFSDKYFDSGTDMLAYNQDRYGYEGSYNTVVSYAVPMVLAEHLQLAYRTLDYPDPLADVLDPEGRERLRRQMYDLRGDTIFGPILFNQFRRNVGREAASTQWQPIVVIGNGEDAIINNSTGTGTTTILQNVLVSPISQADAAAIVPAMSALDCNAGLFVNVSLIETGSALLSNKCSACPVDTFTTHMNGDMQCQPCPGESASTEGEIGQTQCIQYEDNLLTNGSLAFGYVMLGISWLLSLFFLGWVILYRNDPVVQLAQVQYLVMISIGGMISSASIIGMTFQAETGDDTTSASWACMTIPFLYSFGWVLQYASLSAKTLRLHKIIENPTLKRLKLSALQSGWVVLAPLAIDMILVTAWTLVNPLHYIREVSNQGIDSGIVTIVSTGQCRPSEDGSTVWAFVAPLLTHHVCLMLITHALLRRVQNVNDRYQERRFIGMAAVFALEVAIMGVPILIASKDSVEASFFVMTGIVSLDNIGVLCFIFIPKMIYQRRGLEEGVSVPESILRASHDKAIYRERSRRLSLRDNNPQRCSSSAFMLDKGYGPSSLESPSVLLVCSDCRQRKINPEREKTSQSAGSSIIEIIPKNSKSKLQEE